MPGPRVARCPAVGVAALALILGGPASAQPPRPAAPPQPVAGPPKTLYLVLRTGPAETEKQIISKLENGLRHVNAATDGPPVIKPVSPSFVEELESLANRATAVPAAGAALRLLPSRDAAYEIKIPDTQVLKALRVKYQKAGLKEYQPSAPGEKGSLVLTVPGRYAFTPLPDDPPLEYEGDVSELGKPDATFKNPWPKSDKFFVVTMKNFRGDKQELFKAIQDNTVVPNPFVLSDEKSDLIFAFAGLNSSIGRPGRIAINDKNELIVSVETLTGENPKRVWAYFPLSEAAVAEKLAAFRKFESTELPAEIRKNAVPAGQLASIGAKDGPKWHEIPVKPAASPIEFERLVKLNGLGELASKYPKMWMLVVWEFDSGKPEAILVEDKDDKSGRVSVLKREMADWAQGVQDALKKGPPLEPKP